MTPEGKVKKKIKAMLDEAGAYYVMVVTGGFGHSGHADFIGIHNSKGFVIEAKADTELTALQKKNLRKAKEAGGVALVVRTRSNGEKEGWDELAGFLKGA